MNRFSILSPILLAVMVIAPCFAPSAAAQGNASAARKLYVRQGKSLIVDSNVTIERIAVADIEVAEAVAVSPREVLVNGIGVGETSMIIWQQSGNRMLFDLNVLPDTSIIDSVRAQIDEEFGEGVVALTHEHGTTYLRGTVANLGSADRAETIAEGIEGRLVNLLHVEIPDVETQILLKVKFANVDRSALTELGATYILNGALNTTGALSTGQFNAPRIQQQGGSAGGSGSGSDGVGALNLSDILSVFIFRPDLDFGAAIRALRANNLLQILAEPNVLAINGQPASFLAGGEFPFPTIQGGGFGGAVTVTFREFGVRIEFTPHVTPRGTIRLGVAPEVSSLDFANGLTLQGFTIPALSTRRVETNVELESGQSFAIGGLLDNRTTEQLSRIPGLGDIPFFGRLFRSRKLSANRTELIVIVTPEIVRPMTDESQQPMIPMPLDFLEGGVTESPSTPGMDVTGPVPVTPPGESLPVEQMRAIEARDQAEPTVLEPIQRPWVLPVGPVPVQQSAPAAATPQGP